MLKAVSYDALGNKGEVLSASYTFDMEEPEVEGVEDGEEYNVEVTPTFTEGTATLQKMEVLPLYFRPERQ